MTPERWKRVQELYHSARERVESDRARFLAGACAGDAALQREVEALLGQPVSTSGFIDFLGGPAPAGPRGNGGNLLGRRLGSYHVQSLLGMGGMGEVYRAHEPRWRHWPLAPACGGARRPVRPTARSGSS